MAERKRSESLGFNFLPAMWLALASLPFWSCSRPSPQHPQVFRFAMLSPLTSLDPVQTVDASSLQIHLNVYSLLFRQRTNGDLEADLARQAVPNPQRTRWELVLRKGVRFCGDFSHEVGAEDVVATIKRAATHANSRVKWVFRALRKDESGEPMVFASGPDRVTLEFMEPIDLPRYLALPQLAILPREVATNPNFGWSNRSFGSGPFALTKMTPEALILERCPTSSLQASVETVEVKVIRDPEVTFSLFRAAEIDAFELSLAQQHRLRTDRNAFREGTVLTVPGSVHWEFLAFDTRHGFTRSQSLRRALLWAVDRQELCQGPLLGTCKAADFVSALRKESLTQDLLFQPERARREWDKLEAKPSSLRILCPSNDRSLTVARFVSAVWRTFFGIESSIQPMENAPLFARLLSGEPFDTALFWVQPLVDLPEIWFLPWQPGDFPPAGRNFTGYVNPTFEQLFSQMRKGLVLSPAFYQELESVLEGDPPAVPILQRNAAFLVNARYSWRIGPTLALEFWTVTPSAAESGSR